MEQQGDHELLVNTSDDDLNTCTDVDEIAAVRAKRCRHVRWLAMVVVAVVLAYIAATAEGCGTACSWTVAHDCTKYMCNTDDKNSEACQHSSYDPASCMQVSILPSHDCMR